MRHVKSLCCPPETNVTVRVNSTSVKKTKSKWSLYSFAGDGSDMKVTCNVVTC